MATAYDQTTTVMDRTILVTKIPFDTDDIGKLKDILKLHFSKRQNGGGDVEQVVCPFGASQSEALIVFDSNSVIEKVVDQKHNIGNGAVVDVQRLPPVFTNVIGHLDDFYCRVLPKNKYEELDLQLTNLLTKEKGLRRNCEPPMVTGTIDHLKKIEKCIIETIGVTGENLKSDVTEALERIVHINNVPYLTDDVEQLHEELKAHFKHTISVELQDLLCPIMGELTKAIAVFKSVEDRNLFLQHGDYTFFETLLHVEKLPQVFKMVNGTVDDLYMKHIPRKKFKELVHLMQGRFGSHFTMNGQVLTGNMKQLCEAANLVLSTVGLGPDHKTSESTKDSGPQDTDTMTPVEEHFSDPSNVSNYCQKNQQTEGSADESASDTATATNYSETCNSKPERGFKNGFITVDKIIYQYMNIHHKAAINKLESNHKVKIKPSTRDSSNPNEQIMEVQAKRSRSTKGNDDAANMGAQEEFTQLYSEVISNTKKVSSFLKSVDKKMLKKVQEKMKKDFPNITVSWNGETECILCGEEKDVDAAAQDLNDFISCFESVSVDKIAFEYLSTVHKNQLDDISKKFHITLEILEAATFHANQQAVYIKAVKGGKKKCSLEHLQQAKEEFISLYQKTFYSIRRAPVNCKDISERVINDVTKSIMKTSANVFIIKGATTDEIIICAEESNADEVVREFRNIAGLLPKRRLKSSKLNDIEQLTSGSSQCTPNSSEIKRIDENAQSTSHGNRNLSTSKFVTKEGLEVIVVTDDITKQKVDVIVNAANRNLQHDGGVAKAISVAAGPELQTECNDILRRSYLSVGECIHTNSFKLICKQVLHAVGPRYQDDKTSFFSLLEGTFSTALQKIEMEIGAHSVAIPLISSGAFGGPKQCCAKALVKSLYDFSRNRTEQNLRRVYLVNTEDETTHVLQQTCLERFQPISHQNKDHSVNMIATTTTHKSTYKTSNGLEIIIANGDITQAQVDVIVNAANPHLRHDRGVAGAISKAAGVKLQEECARIMVTRPPLRIAECLPTDGYKLQSKILHTVGPRFQECSSDEEFYSSLKLTFFSALRYANIHIEAKQVAIPLISSGIYGGPKHICANALLDAIEEFNMEPTLVIKTLHLINLDDDSTNALQDVFVKRYSDRSLVRSVSTAIAASEFCLNYKTVNGIDIYVEEGDITTKVVDVIVSPTDKYLRNQIGVAKAISSAAGDKYQERCKNIMEKRKHHALEVGEVVETQGFRLKCKHILHAVSPVFIGNKTGAKRKYHDTLTQIFKTCVLFANDTLGVQSLAIPLIGAGSSGAPKEVCANALARTIKMFDEMDLQFLKQLFIISIDKEAILAIQMTLNDHIVDHTSSKINNRADISPTEMLAPNMFETDEGMLLVIQHGNIVTQKADVMINCTDDKLRNTSGIAKTVSCAAGQEFQRECGEYIKNRKSPLKPGEIITTKGYQLQTANVLHIIKPKDDEVESLLLNVFLHAGTTLAAKTIALPLVGDWSESGIDVCAQKTARTVKRYSRMNKSVVKIHFVNEDISASTELDKACSSLFKPISVSRKDAQRATSQEKENQYSKDALLSTRSINRDGQQTNVVYQGALLKKAQSYDGPLNQQPENKQGDYPVQSVQQTGYFAGLVTPIVNAIYPNVSSDARLSSEASPNSHYKKSYSSVVSGDTRKAHPRALEMVEQTYKHQQKCDNCRVNHGVKQLEGCGHAFCKRCIIQHIAPKAKCLTCSSLYCVASEKKRQGTMTYFIQSDVDLPGEVNKGAITVMYEFPYGISGAGDSFPGRQYTGNSFTAYLPNTSEALGVVWLLRTAFITDLTFAVKHTSSGALGVMWSGAISHKRNIKGGVGNHGYPDPNYLQNVKEELKKYGIVGSQSGGS